MFTLFLLIKPGMNCNFRYMNANSFRFVDYIPTPCLKERRNTKKQTYTQQTNFKCALLFIFNSMNGLCLRFLAYQNIFTSNKHLYDDDFSGYDSGFHHFRLITTFSYLFSIQRKKKKTNLTRDSNQQTILLHTKS